MGLSFTPLHPLFAAEARGVDLRAVEDRATLDAIRAGMDAYGVLVFRGQPLTDAEQLAFAERFDGTLHTKTGVAALTKNRFGNDVSDQLHANKGCILFGAGDMSDDVHEYNYCADCKKYIQAGNCSNVVDYLP